MGRLALSMSSDSLRNQYATGGVGQLWVKRGTRWIDTGDMVEMLGQSRLRVVGRHHSSFKTLSGTFFHPEPLEALLVERCW